MKCNAVNASTMLIECEIEKKLVPDLPISQQTTPTLKTATHGTVVTTTGIK